MSPEQMGQVKDFAIFLKSRADQPVDDSDEWTDEDVRDAANASLAYAEAKVSIEERSDADTG